jgi:exodeoxyribonuclease V beta subunit
MSAIRPDDHLLRGAIADETTLLEASAGTGKTFTISHRVVRLLLERSIPIQDILVVTFTRAATRELRDRVRRVIVEARELLEQSLAGLAVHEPPAALEALLARDEAGRRAALALARRALDNLDLASIFTIHGFCDRALSLHALELGYDTGAKLTATVEGALGAVVDDLYVKRITAASTAERKFLAETGYTPSALREVAKSAWGLRGVPISGEAPGVSFDELVARIEGWSDRIARDADEIARATAPRLIRYGRAKKRETVERQLREDCEKAALRARANLQSLFATKTSELPQKLRPSALHASGLVRPEAEIDHPLLLELDLLGDLARQVANQPFREMAVRAPELVERELSRRGELGFDQLIGTIHRVVSDPVGAARLRSTLGARFKAVLIDEFQDTDEAQWAIFHSLFGEGKVFDLVGDPKQAIYGFRGADVHAYAAAKKKARARSTMQVNYRSDAGYVEAMNVLFGLEGTPAEGAAPETRRTLGSNEIEYVGVRAAEKHQRARLRASGRAPLSLVRLTETVGSDRLAAVVAEAIVELLNGGAEIEGDDGFRPVRPGDFAVLTRVGKIGRRVADELRLRGVPCVTSQSENVWGSDAAALLDGLLTSALHPHDRDALRAVAIDRLFDLPADALDDRDGRLGRIAALVREVKARLEEQGVAAAVVHLLASSAGGRDETVAAHVLAHQRGERLVTDLRHLGELLHLEALSESLGLGEILERLRERRAEGKTEEPEHQQRLESDADSVNITTIHSSKGLEYPIVLLPDLDIVRAPKADDHTLDYHDAEGRRRLDVGKHRAPGDEALRRAILESRQEAMRLLYVAFTRARCHAMAFFYLPNESWPKNGGRHGRFALSPLAATLFGEGEGERRLEAAEARVLEATCPETLGALEGCLEALVDRSGGTIDLRAAGAPALTSYRKPARDAGALTALAYEGPERLEYGYSDYSYSRIVNSMEHALEERGGMDEGAAPGEALDASGGEEDLVPLARLEKGANVGTFAHAVFEHLDFTTGAPKPGRAQTTFELALDHAQREGLETANQSAELFSGALPGVLGTPLGGELGELGLSALRVEDRLDEVDFHLAIDADGKRWTKVRDVAAALGRSTEGLEEASLRGFVMGSIDLVFRVEGAQGTRYFVADYKSNFLGPRLDDYLPARLERAMDEHRYWLQAAFYLLALDRFLEERLGAVYDYETHCGGALYLFFRGMVGERSRVDAERTRGVHLIRPSAEEMRALRAALSGGRR